MSPKKRKAAASAASAASDVQIASKRHTPAAKSDGNTTDDMFDRFCDTKHQIIMKMKEAEEVESKCRSDPKYFQQMLASAPIGCEYRYQSYERSVIADCVVRSEFTADSATAR